MTIAGTATADLITLEGFDPSARPIHLAAGSSMKLCSLRLTVPIPCYRSVSVLSISQGNCDKSTPIRENP